MWKQVQDEVLDLALDRTELSPRELACRHADEKRYLVSESSVDRILKRADFGRRYEIVSEREKIKRRTMRKSKREYRAAMAA